MPNKKIIGNILGFDFGFKHIGVAIGNTDLTSSRPLTRLKANDGIPHWDSIDTIINEWAVAAIVVGQPYNIDGSHQEVTHAANKFSRRLASRYAIPVFNIDERYSTKEARSLNKKALEYDSLAAKIILDCWLRIHNSSSENNGN